MTLTSSNTSGVGTSRLEISVSICCMVRFITRAHDDLVVSPDNGHINRGLPFLQQFCDRVVRVLSRIGWRLVRSLIASINC